MLAYGVPMSTRQRFVHAQLAWMLGTVVALSVLGALSLEIFFIVSLAGILVLIELTAPVNVSPRWRTRLRWLILLGMVVFGVFMARRILELLPPGML